MTSKETVVHRPWHPRFWPTWAGVALLWLCGQLSFPHRIKAGRLLGRIMYHLARQRRHIASTNLTLCFPGLGESEHREWLRRTMEEQGIGLFETAYAYFGNPSEVLLRTHYEGVQLLKTALAEGRGILLIGAHYSALDLGGLLMTPHCKVVTMYRANKNPVLNEVIKRRRARFTLANYERHQLRPVLKHLREGNVVWYAPDQDYGAKVSVFAPFFGVPAATITTTAKLASFNQSRVLMLGYHRDDDDQGYTLRIQPFPADFPTGDDITDATLVNEALEDMIRLDPVQYMWVHRRFKTRPDGATRPY